MPLGLVEYEGALLADANGAFAGIRGRDGREYLVNRELNTAALSPISRFNPGWVTLTSGTINGTSVGVTAPAVVRASDYQAARTDSSGTPGNSTINTPRGRAAFAASSNTVTITSSLVTATSTVLVQLGGADATLSSVRVTAGAGSFTVTGNAAATAATPFDFLVIN